MADTSISSGKLLVDTSEWGGYADVENFSDNDYMVEVVVDLSSGSYADILLRKQDDNNAYIVRLASNGTSSIIPLIKGSFGYSQGNGPFTPSSGNAVKIKVEGSTIKYWIDGALKRTEGISFPTGGVAFGGDQRLFDNVEIGYDTDEDDDLDGDDDRIMNEDFASTSTTIAHDHAGNLIDDGIYQYPGAPGPGTDWSRSARTSIPTSPSRNPSSTARGGG